MLRRLALIAVAALVLVGCNNCDKPCKQGITFVVAEVAGALSAGGKAPVRICFDGDCKDITITRDQVGGSLFVPFSGVGDQGDHEVTVTGTGTASLQGSYTGPVYSYKQDPRGSCSSCDLATVKIAADGTLTPAVPAPTDTTTTVGTTVGTPAST
ncbi:MAG: hypothetical protein ABI894_17880 [Ilumatobacteraceae bacterium]